MITPVSGTPNLLLGAYDPATLGYGAEEFFVSGSAESYASDDTADYTTRIVVLQPLDRTAFNGTVIVEWLNVSGGLDAPAVWSMAHREIARSGYAYVGVSAQQVGIEGGTSLVGMDMSLKTQNPERYSQLHHPGDEYSYDIYTQVGRLIRGGAIDGLGPETVLAVGESQSAVFLTTYINVVDPEAATYDGFLVHSRFGNTAPLDGVNVFEEHESTMAPVPFRSDPRVPVLAFITETDLLGGFRVGYHAVRQPDSDLLRTWELAGAAHADNYTIIGSFMDSGSAPLADLAATYAPTNELMGEKLSYHINFGPQHHYVLQAAVAHLNNWVRTGKPAPAAAPITLTGSDPVSPELDDNGLAKGGVRTPWVDVPTARLSGLAPNESLMSFIFGSGEVFDADTLARLYPGGKADYLERFAVALDQTIEAGFILAADRAEILELAAATFPGG
ncbi:alpha/beta hydrolase domain-containing protein [Mycolicibacterium moriokaense]|uniref:Alpha/beta hydrolase domain-containing protein n=1 Tax=Mycolicibacterium moriokaense TaxID=39691 RepID=A0AAD1HHW1_9MYCO|nr:alpha/beta hydrolase domain-containing protein [Mycolicibacterium moriokaense]MCV7042332.1 hypothetical protein [Mycolicibacterium moriokaense]BBX05105.1 hypothetical protein MMOR_60410 [Mycolicibacterium moriokaense]